MSGEIEILRRHVVEGERRVARQQELVERLAHRRLPIEQAQRVLASLAESLRLAREHLRRREIKKDPGPRGWGPG